MLLCNMLLVVTLFCVKSSLGGFSSGRVLPGMFEYSQVNGWMKPAEAAKLCEQDIQCGGFTFHGTLTYQIVYEVYFFHFVWTIHLVEGGVTDWGWTAYVVKRKYIALPGTFPLTKNNIYIAQKTNFKSHPEFGAQLCERIDFCAGLSQNERGDIFKLETVFFQDYVKDENWTTVVLLSVEKNQMEDNDPMNLDLCCPEQPQIPHIKLGRQEVPMQITRVTCDISPDLFNQQFVARRIPVLLEGCVDQNLFSTQTSKPPTFGHFTFDDLLKNFFSNENNVTTGNVPKPKIRQKIIELMKMTKFNINYKIASKLIQSILLTNENPQNSSSWTHDRTPNYRKATFEEASEMRKKKKIRTFLKLSSLVTNIDCYDKFHNLETGTLKLGYVQCLILGGLWKPPPLPSDLYAATKYPNDLAWMILSGKNTGSQLHVDPDLMGAWSLLLLGRKWWVVSPTLLPIERITCRTSCSPGFQDGSNTWPWFQHILPQLKGKKFYGKAVIEFVQLPGDVLYLPHGMPHTVHNVDDNIAVTENWLFSDALPGLVKAMAANMIHPWVPHWNETLAYHNLYMKHSNKDNRLKMREMYQHVTNLSKRYPHVC